MSRPQTNEMNLYMTCPHCGHRNRKVIDVAKGPGASTEKCENCKEEFITTFSFRAFSRSYKK